MADRTSSRVAAGRGSIVNASIGGVRVISGLGAYAAAKHGVVGLTRSAAIDGGFTAQ